MVTSRWKEIRLWDTGSWTVVGSLATHRENSSHHLALSPDGTKLADVVQMDYRIGPDQIDLWDVSGKQLVRSLPGRYLGDGSLGDGAIEFSPDGNLLVVGSWDGTVRIWNVADLFSTDSFAADDEPAPVWTLRMSNPVRALDISSDSKRLAVATALRSALLVPEAVQVWDIASRERMAVFEDHSKAVIDVAFIGDGNTIGTISDDQTLKTWDLTESRAYDVIDGVEWRSGFSYDRDGSVIYQDRTEGKIRSWNRTQRESHSFLDADNGYSRLGFSSNGRFLAAVTQEEDRLRVWDLADGIECHSAKIRLDDLRRRIESEGGVSSPRGNQAGQRDHDKALITRLTVSNDGLFVAFAVPLIREGSEPALVVLIDSEDGHPIEQAQHWIYANSPPTFSPSGRQLATNDHFGVYTHVSDIFRDHLRPRLPIPAPLPLCVAFSPDGGTLAIGNFNNEIRLHRAADGTLLQTLSDHAQWPQSVAFSGNGRHLASAGSDGRVLIWKKGSDGKYRVVSTLRGLPEMDLMQAVIAPGNESLAVLHALSYDPLKPLYDGKIQVWRGASPGETRQPMEERLFRMGSHTVRPLERLDELNQILLHDPDDLRARAVRGEVHDALGDGRSAAADWTVALQQVPDNLYFLESRAKAYELAGQWSQAKDDWTTLVRLVQASNGKYLLGRGECYLHMGRLNDAHEDFIKALERTASPDTIQRIASLLGLGEALVPVGSGWQYQTGTEPEADWATLSFNDSQWQTAWAPFGGYQRFLPTRTRVHAQDVWLRHAFELDHDIDAPLALRMRAEGNVEVFVNGVSAAPESVPNYFDDDQWNVWNWNKYVRMYSIVPCSGKVHLHKGKNVLAVRCRNPEHTRNYVDVGLYVANEAVDIGSMLDKLADRVPNSAHLHTALAIRFVEQQRWKEAALHFKKSARISDEQSLPKWMWAALMYRQAKDDKSYHDLIAEIVDRFERDDSAERLGRLAKTCLLAEPTAENRPGLIDMADRALKLDPHNPSALVAKALAAFWNDQLEDAIQWARKYEKENYQALCVIALAHAKMGKPQLARNELAQCEGVPELRLQVSFRKKDAAHENAFLKILREIASESVSRTQKMVAHHGLH